MIFYFFQITYFMICCPGRVVDYNAGDFVEKILQSKGEVMGN
jgi:hypothetical protein